MDGDQDRVCPFCGSMRCAEILYGRIAETEDLREAIRRGDVVLGGCMVAEGMPAWRCVECGKEWGSWTR